MAFKCGYGNPVRVMLPLKSAEPTAKVSITDKTGNHTLKMRFDIHQHTLLDVKQAYIDEVDSSRRVDTLDLIDAGKTLKDDHKTLEQLGADEFDIENGINYLLALRLPGGGSSSSKPNHSNILDRDRARSLHPKLPRSDKACCVYGDKSLETTELECGHAFSAQSMFDTMKAVIRGSRYKFTFSCPLCGIKIPYKEAAYIASLDAEERAFFNTEISKRMCPMKTCPNCQSNCIRPEGLALFRVSCGGCGGADWCWQCGGKWKSSGFTVCGNSNCHTYHLNKILRSCKTKKSGSTYNVKIPEYRACPKCATLIMHNDACKHMDCECGFSFCFVCLQPKGPDGRYPCGSHEDQCQPAARQQF